jgi:murein DD-endopeptidase MepM/ murein hydrolase activator NlpD
LFQLISNKRRYNFNHETLTFEKPVKSKTKRILLLSAVFGILVAGFTFLINKNEMVPFQGIYKNRIENLSNHYNILNARLDSQQVFLSEVLFGQDEYYREILELDTLSSSVRMAGIGGSSPSESYESDIIVPIKREILAFQSQLNIQDKSFEEILYKAREREEKLDKIPAISPLLLKNIWISSYYGGRIDPFTHKIRIHRGIDFVGPKYTKIYATGDGIVTLAKYSRNGYGNEVVISHGFGYSTRYAHLSKILVKEGEQVKRGQLIGKMGSTGRSTGTHLHYEVRYDNFPVNPIYYFSEDLTPSEYEEMTGRINEN